MVVHSDYGSTGVSACIEISTDYFLTDIIHQTYSPTVLDLFLDIKILLAVMETYPWISIFIHQMECVQMVFCTPAWTEG
jgi:hypothetical protein